MKRKICVVVLILLIVSMALSACNMEKETPPVYIKTSGGSYQVLGVSMASQYSGVAAPAGNAYLMVTVGGQNVDMDDMDTAFLGNGETPAKVSTSTEEAECIKVGYGAKNVDEGQEILATLVFEVSADFSGSFTLTANGANPVALDYKAPADEK